MNVNVFTLQWDNRQTLRAEYLEACWLRAFRQVCRVWFKGSQGKTVLMPASLKIVRVPFHPLRTSSRFRVICSAPSQKVQRDLQCFERHACVDSNAD